MTELEQAIEKAIEPMAHAVCPRLRFMLKGDPNMECEKCPDSSFYPEVGMRGTRFCREVAEKTAVLARDAFLAAMQREGFRFERDWMPIESAPKDGTPLLLWMAQPVYSRDIQLYVPWDCAQVAIGWWTDEEWEICWVQEGSCDSDGFTNWFYMGAIYKLPSPPLLWKPLPEGPTK